MQIHGDGGDEPEIDSRERREIERVKRWFFIFIFSISFLKIYIYLFSKFTEIYLATQ